MDITLNWLINESSLEDIRLVTCQHLSSTLITGVNIMDNPDTVQWIRPGELILTTGYIFLDNEPLQLQMLRDLKDSGCAGLCLKTKRFLDQFPEHMVSLAEEIGLPLLELPYYYSLAFISDEIQHQLFLSQFQEATAEQQLLNTLFNSYFQGKSLNEILATFSAYINSSVFILNNQNQAPWYALTPEDAMLSYFTPPFSTMKLLRQQQMQDPFYLKGHLLFENRQLPVALLPFSTPKYTLCILHHHPEDLPWDTIHHVLKIIDFSRMNTGFHHTTVTNYYDSFFQYLMNAENFTETSSIQLYEYYGIPVPPSSVCVIFRRRHQNEHLQAPQLISRIKNHLQSLNVAADSYFTAYSENLVCLCLFSSMESMLPDLREILDEILKDHSQKLLVGISRPLPGDLPQAFKEASFMLSLHKYFPEESVFFFQDYLTFWQISQMAETEKRTLYKITVEPLIQFDEKNHTNLTETLRMYFHCQLNSSMAANRLFIHRNTFLKRMEKIRNILNFLPDNPTSLYSIYLGLCIQMTLD